MGLLRRWGCRDMDKTREVIQRFPTSQWARYAKANLRGHHALEEAMRGVEDCCGKPLFFRNRMKRFFDDHISSKTTRCIEQPIFPIFFRCNERRSTTAPKRKKTSQKVSNFLPQYTMAHAMGAPLPSSFPFIRKRSRVSYKKHTAVALPQT